MNIIIININQKKIIRFGSNGCLFHNDNIINVYQKIYFEELIKNNFEMINQIDYMYIIENKKKKWIKIQNQKDLLIDNFIHY